MKMDPQKMFEPNSSLLVKNVPDHGAVEVPSHRTLFKSWAGPPVFDFGGKPLLDYNGSPVFAELLIQRQLSRDDWNAVCVECWANGLHYIRKQILSWRLVDHADSPDTVPEHVRRRVEDLVACARNKPDASGNVGKGSAPDVVAWNSAGAIRFLEAKRKGKDAPNDNQKRFISALIEKGYELERTFTFVEWELLDAGG